LLAVNVRRFQINSIVISVVQFFEREKKSYNWIYLLEKSYFTVKKGDM